jgi:hypothetical protein
MCIHQSCWMQYRWRRCNHRLYISIHKHTYIYPIVLSTLCWVKFSGMTHNRQSLYLEPRYTSILTSSLASTSAPFPNKCDTTLSCPSKAAQWRAVFPTYKKYIQIWKALTGFISTGRQNMSIMGMHLWKSKLKDFENVPPTVWFRNNHTPM